MNRFVSGLHFNKFTDSCDYATNVGCTVGSTASTTTTTTTTARPKVTSRTSKPRPVTRTTTPEPEEEEEIEEEEEEEPVAVKKAGADEDPEELQQLLQLITDLGKPTRSSTHSQSSTLNVIFLNKQEE